MSSSMSKTEAYVGKTDLFKIDPRKIVIEPGHNPRTRPVELFEIESLMDSIRVNGFYLDKPLLLNRRGTQLVLVDGERRLRAVLALIEEGEQVVSVPAVLEISQNPAVLLARALAANQNTLPLTPEEEARAFKRLIGYGWVVVSIAAQIGKSQSYVYGRLKLLEARDEVLEAAREGSITTSDAVRVVETANRENVAQEVVLERKKAERQAKKAPKSVDDRTSDQKDTDVLFELFEKKPTSWFARKLMLWHGFDTTEQLRIFCDELCAEMTCVMEWKDQHD